MATVGSIQDLPFIYSINAALIKNPAVRVDYSINRDIINKGAEIHVSK